MKEVVEVELRCHTFRSSAFLAVCRAGASGSVVGVMALGAGPDLRPRIAMGDVAQMVGAAHNARPITVDIYPVRGAVADIGIVLQLAGRDPRQLPLQEVETNTDQRSENPDGGAASTLVPKAAPRRPFVIDTPVASQLLRTGKTSPATTSDADKVQSGSRNRGLLPLPR